jgi:hypothetical protein
MKIIIYCRMKIVIVCFMILSSLLSFGQNQSGMGDISTEAYQDFRKNGGTNEQWQNYSSEIIERYKKNYYSRGGQSQSDALRDLNKGQQHNTMRSRGERPDFGNNRTRGTIVTSSGNASFDGTYVLNAYGQQVGTLRNGSFFNATNQCLGYINGTSIYGLNGGILASVRGNYIYDSRGSIIYTIKDDYLYSGNYSVAQISGMNMGSLGAFLLLLN